MGGWGSGRRFRFGSTRRVAEDSLPLDIRKLCRQNLLIPGMSFSSEWSTGGNVHSTINAVAYSDRLILKYRYRKTESVEQAICYTYSRCNFGGKRIWFLCPFCSRRCAMVYSVGKYFGCRICGNLAYSTQNETSQDRLFSKANKLRKRIGAKAGCLNSLPVFKPKNMHYATWMRIRTYIKELEGSGMDIAARMLGIDK